MCNDVVVGYTLRALALSRTRERAACLWKFGNNAVVVTYGRHTGRVFSTAEKVCEVRAAVCATQWKRKEEKRSRALHAWLAFFQVISPSPRPLCARGPLFHRHLHFVASIQWGIIAALAVSSHSFRIHQMSFLLLQLMLADWEESRDGGNDSGLLKGIRGVGRCYERSFGRVLVRVFECQGCTERKIMDLNCELLWF